MMARPAAPGPASYRFFTEARMSPAVAWPSPKTGAPTVVPEANDTEGTMDMKGLIVAGVAGLLGIGGVIGASAAMEPDGEQVALTAAAPNTAAALEDRIARLARARREVARTRTTTTVEDRVRAPSGRDDDDRFDDRDDDDDDDHGRGRNRGRGGDDD